MSSTAAAYRALLRALANSIPSDARSDFVAHARQQFRAKPIALDAEATRQRQRLAHDYASLLRASVHHRELLVKYQITVNREGAQREYVESVARRVGLHVPKPLE
jgi:Complex1_LYR-like